MILAKESLDKLLTDMWIRDISEEQRSAILDNFATEPCAEQEWTEQDMIEQIRKMLR